MWYIIGQYAKTGVRIVRYEIGGLRVHIFPMKPQCPNPVRGCVPIRLVDILLIYHRPKTDSGRIIHNVEMAMIDSIETMHQCHLLNLKS